LVVVKRKCGINHTECDRRNTMGTIIRFPLERLSCHQPTGPRRLEPASVVILPVVRIERWIARLQLEEPAAVAKTPGFRPAARGRNEAVALTVPPNLPVRKELIE
jgi:hypothetical protein